MEGHIYKPNCKCPKDQKCRCKAKWAYIVDVGINPATGKRRQKFKGGFDTKKQAEEAKNLFLSEISNTKYTDPSKMIFEDLAQEWLNDYSNQDHIKLGTIRVRKHEIDKLNAKLRFAKIKKIDHKMYQEIINEIKLYGKDGEPLADSTMSGVHGTAGQIFKYAMKMKYIKENPTEYAKVKKERKTVFDIENRTEIPKYMEKEQLALFLQGTIDYGLEGDLECFHTIAYSGMRVGEWCALSFTSLDYKEESIFISKTLYNPTNHGLKYQIIPPKTKRSIRHIKMDHNVMKILRSLEIKHKKIKLQNPNFFDGGFVSAMTGNRKHAGHPENVKMIELRMARILRLTGLDSSFTPHSLRHTHVSLLAEARVPLEVIMERLGHADDEITKLIYLHVTKDLKKEAVQRFSDLLNGPR